MNSKAAFFSLIALISALLHPALIAQEQEEETQIGYFYMVNATGFTEPIMVKLDGKIINSRGLGRGQWGGGGLDAGSYRVGVEHPQTEPAEAVVKVEPAEGGNYIVYSIPFEDPDTGEIKRRLVIQKAPSMATGNEWRLGVLNASNREGGIRIRINGEQVEVPKFGAKAVPGWGGNFVKASQREETFFEERLEDRGSFLLIISDVLEDGGLAGTLIADTDYEFHLKSLEELEEEEEQEETAEAAGDEETEQEPGETASSESTPG